MSGVGGYVRRKDRHMTRYALHYDREAHLGRLRHFVMPSGAVISWRLEPPMFGTALSPMRFEQFGVTDEHTSGNLRLPHPAIRNDPGAGCPGGQNFRRLRAG